MSNILYIYIPISTIIIPYLFYRHYRIRTILHEQNSRLIGLYLDKKFVTKLLKTLLEVASVERIHYIADEIISYFCLDFLALKVTGSENMISFKSRTSKLHYLENDVKTILNKSSDIDEEIGSTTIENNSDDQQFVVFKYKKLSLLAAAEPKHILSKSEINTLENEVMQIISTAIMLNANIEEKSHFIA